MGHMESGRHRTPECGMDKGDGFNADIKSALRDVLWEQSHFSRMLDALAAKGPCHPESERVLVGSLLAGDTVPGNLSPCVAMDFATPMCRAIYLACCVVEPGEANPRLAKIILAMEADGVLGVTVDELLRLREWSHGERLEPHIRNVAEAGAARRMARYLETMASDIRLGRLSATEAEQRLNRKLRGPQAGQNRREARPVEEKSAPKATVSVLALRRKQAR